MSRVEMVPIFMENADRFLNKCDRLDVDLCKNHAVEDQDLKTQSLDSEDSVLSVPPPVGDEQLRDETAKDNEVNHVSDDGDHEKSDATDVSVPDELCDKIKKQVEFYFSDANILKDSFLLRHVLRNKAGYVNIKLISTFKKIKTLTKDYRIVASSLRQSDELEVNEEGTKVRRRKDLPEYDETTPFRTVVVGNLDHKNPTVESVADMFSKCGEVVLVRILRPGNSIPPDVNKYAMKHPEIGTATCAVVEFKKHEHAKTACDTMTNTTDWRTGMRVDLLGQLRKKNDKPEKETGNMIAPKEADVDRNNKKKKVQKKKTRVDELSAENYSSCCDSSSDGEGSGNISRNKKNSRHANPNPSSSPASSPRIQGRRSHGKSHLTDLTSQNNVHGTSSRSGPEMALQKQATHQNDSLPSSPWVQRRLRAALETKANGSPANSPQIRRRDTDGNLVPGSGPKMLDMMGVLRQPRGPDGSKGFYGGLGRGKPHSNTVV